MRALTSQLDNRAMVEAPHTSRLNRSIDIAMDRPFTLTIAFIVGSAILLIAAVFAANLEGRRIGEASTIRLGSELAEAEAKLLGDSFGQILSESDLSGFSGGYSEGELPQLPADGSPDPLLSLLLILGNNDLESLIPTLGIYHLGILTADGVELWSIGSESGPSHHSDEIKSAASGRTVSWLNRDAEIIEIGGEMVSADLLESMVPLSNPDGTLNGLVFHYVTDMTETLEINVVATQVEIRNAALIMLGILLGILALLVLGLDLRISKRNAAIVQHERTMRQDLDTRNTELQRLDQTKNEFLGSLSHELKTPLAAILGFATILRKNSDDNLKPKQIEQFEIIDRNGIRLDAMIGDLLDLSKIQERNVKLIMEDTELVDLVQNMVEGFELILNAQQQSIDLKIEHERSWLNIDQGRISQVLSNLISNASKYSPMGTVISVTSECDGDTWLFSVKDEGRGIPAEQQENIFTLFYRTPDAVNSSVPGTGIGLYVSKLITELHDGTIDLVSAPGRGTTVTLKLSGLKGAPSKARITGPKFTNVLDDIELNEAV